MMTDLIALTRAFYFAAEKHTDQRRKGSRGEPYVNHLAEVAQLLAEATGGADPMLILGGLLHDTIEDTATSAAELEAAFGREVTELVLEVTDDKNLPKGERKRLQIEKTPQKSDRAKILKLADKISNLRALQRTPPADWSAERRRDYFDWAAKVVAGCRGLNPVLEQEFDRVHEAGMAAFEESAA